MTNRAFRSTRGLIGGMAILLAGVLGSVGLSACGAPQYSYVADSASQTYYKVPSEWHQIPERDLSKELSAQGSTPAGFWSTAFDADRAPTAIHNGAADLTQPFVLAEVTPLSATASNELSYNMLRDLWLPVTSATRQAASSQGFAGTGFTLLRDQVITQKQGVHGVRETFQYTFGGVTDTFDEDVLTNADQTMVYILEVHCTDTCYSSNQKSIDTVMSSFTVGSPA